MTCSPTGSDWVHPESELAARLAPLRGRFLERCRGELPRLRELLDRGGPEAAAELRLLVHRMAGTGATLSFNLLSDAALEVERLLGEDPAAVIADADGRTAVARAIAQLGGLVEAAGTDLPR